MHLLFASEDDILKNVIIALSAGFGLEMKTPDLQPGVMEAEDVAVRLGKCGWLLLQTEGTNAQEVLVAAKVNGQRNGHAAVRERHRQVGCRPDGKFSPIGMQ